MGQGKQYRLQIDVTSPPYGIFLLTFSEDTAEKVAEMMTGQPVEGGEFTDMQFSALKELSNVLTSGFIDGWANALDTTIEIGTPALDRSKGDEIADEVVSHIHEDSLSIVIVIVGRAWASFPEEKVTGLRGCQRRGTVSRRPFPTGEITKHLQETL